MFITGTYIKKFYFIREVVIYTFNPNTWGTKAGRSLSSMPVYKEKLCQKKVNNNNREFLFQWTVKINNTIYNRTKMCQANRGWSTNNNKIPCQSKCIINWAKTLWLAKIVRGEPSIIVLLNTGMNECEHR